MVREETSDSPQRSSEYSIINTLEFQFLPRQLKQRLWVWIKIQWLPGGTWVRLCFLHVEAGWEQTPETWSNTERLALASPRSSHYSDKHSLKHNQLPPQDSKPSTQRQPRNESQVVSNQRDPTVPSSAWERGKNTGFPVIFFFFINTSQFCHYFNNCQRTCKLRWKLFFFYFS